jgi:hypothetical protein
VSRWYGVVNSVVCGFVGTVWSSEFVVGSPTMGAVGFLHGFSVMIFVMGHDQAQVEGSSEFSSWFLCNDFCLRVKWRFQERAKDNLGIKGIIPNGYYQTQDEARRFQKALFGLLNAIPNGHIV